MQGPMYSFTDYKLPRRVPSCGLSPEMWVLHTEEGYLSLTLTSPGVALEVLTPTALPELDT